MWRLLRDPALRAAREGAAGWRVADDQQPPELRTALVGLQALTRPCSADEIYAGARIRSQVTEATC